MRDVLTIQEYLNRKRLKIAMRYLNKIPDLDLGAGSKRKAKVSLDINQEFRPDIVSDIQFLPLKSEFAESIVCSHVIEHVGNIEQTINEIKRILKKQGMVLFFLPNNGSILWRLLQPFWTLYYERAVSKVDSPRDHVHIFNDVKLHSYLSKFFTSIKVGKFNLAMELFAFCKK